MYHAQRFAGVLIAAVFFCAIAPTLSQLQFGDPIENLNVATAMEIRRGGPRLFPTLQGEPRLAKPPLTAWVTAVFLRRSTLAGLDSANPSNRAHALAELEHEARLPALLAMCLMLAVVYELGRAVWAFDADTGHAAGWVSAVVCGSMLIFLRQCRLATTDAQLTLWVATANLCLARAVLHGRFWTGFLGAGAALGLALMTKGPIALVQSVLPFAAFVLWRWTQSAPPAARAPATSSGRRSRAFSLPRYFGGGQGMGPRQSRCSTGPPPCPPPGYGGRETDGSDRYSRADPNPQAAAAGVAIPIFFGVLIMLIVGLAWYACAAVHFRVARSLWFAEATRVGADGPSSGAPWFRYVASGYLFSPWLIWLAAGVAIALPGTTREWSDLQMARIIQPARLALLLLAVPLFLMSFSRDRYERYMTPMAPAAALLAAGPLSAYVRRRASGHGIQSPKGAGSWQPALRRCMTAHAVLTGAGVAGFVIAGASGVFPALRTVRGAPWFTPATAATLCATGVGVLCISAGAARRWRGWAVVATAALPLAGQAIYYNRSGESPATRSTLRPVAEAILARFPDAQLYAWRPGGQNIISVPANDLSIHLNRTVALVADPSRIAESKRPQIYVIYRTRGPKYAELLPPPGWQVLAKPPAGGNEDRYVLVRPGGQQP
jgi:4-amino-4-deoxy-L-arabinose transferase-like glycosyltransferase